MLWRRLVGASILLAWSVGPAMGTLAAAADPHDKCAGHVCQCQRQSHCPPKRPAAKNCHEDSARPACEMTSRCNHESDPLPVASRSDSILTRATEFSLVLEWQPTPAEGSPRAKAGYARLDIQPPRVA